MTSVIEVHDLSKRYREPLAIDDVGFSLEENTIHGLLGRNGAGTTTVMSIPTAQNVATSGDIRVFGMKTCENAKAPSRMRIGRGRQIETCPDR